MVVVLLAICVNDKFSVTKVATYIFGNLGQNNFKCDIYHNHSTLVIYCSK